MYYTLTEHQKKYLQTILNDVSYNYPKFSVLERIVNHGRYEEFQKTILNERVVPDYENFKKATQVR